MPAPPRARDLRGVVNLLREALVHAQELQRVAAEEEYYCHTRRPYTRPEDEPLHDRCQGIGSTAELAAFCRCTIAEIRLLEAHRHT